MTAIQDFDTPTFEYAYFLHSPAAPPPVALHETDSAEFARAMGDYKDRHNRPFPTWSEVLEVLRGLGYAKRSDFAAPSRHEVRINRAGPAAEEIRETLTRLGGVPLPPPTAGKFRFPSAPARDRALDAVRADQGWTSVEPL